LTDVQLSLDVEKPEEIKAEEDITPVEAAIETPI
jgi:hypothetical protein